MTELVFALEKMGNSDFKLHITKSRNDFAEWILETYNNEKLTKKILGTTNKNKIIKLLNMAIKEAEKEKPTIINIPKNKKSTLKILGEINNGGM